MGTSLADPGVSVTGTYTGGGRGVLAILRSLRQGTATSPTRALRRAAPRDEGFHGGLLSAPLSALPLSATRQGTVTVPRAAAALHASPAARPGHPHTHKGRHHRRAHKHRAPKHKAHKHKRSKHRAHKHRARQDRPISTALTSTAPPPPRP